MVTEWVVCVPSNQRRAKMVKLRIFLGKGFLLSLFAVGHLSHIPDSIAMPDFTVEFEPIIIAGDRHIMP